MSSPTLRHTVDGFLRQLRTYKPLASRHGIRPTSGEGTIRPFAAGFYPACTKHGAMNRVHPTLRMWRCLADEWTCNCGLIHKDDIRPVSPEEGGEQ